MVSPTGSHRATSPSCTSRLKCGRYTLSPPSRSTPRAIGLMPVIRAPSTESTALRWGRDGPAATAVRRDPGARRSPPRAGGRRLSDGRRLLRHGAPQPRRDPDRRGGAHDRHAEVERSEEHTSELQSPCNLVCRLLLEKKKKEDINKHYSV